MGIDETGVNGGAGHVVDPGIGGHCGIIADSGNASVGEDDGGLVQFLSRAEHHVAAHEGVDGSGKRAVAWRARALKGKERDDESCGT